MSEGGAAPRIVRFAATRRLPWKNGGGETAEVAVHPPGSTLDAFGWRVSLARITGEGPFSTFHNVDRTFAVLDGDGLVLAIAAGRPIRLDHRSEPIRFAGEASCSCSPSDGPVTALNVMTERGSFDCAASRVDPVRGLSLGADAVSLLICEDGEIASDLGPLYRLDVLVVPVGAAVAVRPGPRPARALCVSIWVAGRPRSADDGWISPP